MTYASSIFFKKWHPAPVSCNFAKIIRKLSWFLEASFLEIFFSCFFSSLLLLLEDLTFFHNNLSTINLPSSPDLMRFQAWLTVSFTRCVLNGALSSGELTRQSES